MNKVNISQGADPPIRRLEKGQGLSEYALILVLVSIAAIVGLTVMGETVSDQYTCISYYLNGMGSVSIDLYDGGSQLTGADCGSTITSTNSTVVANFKTQPESVKFTITGPVNHTQVEDLYPFTLFGDNDGDMATQTFPPGKYTVVATAYDQDGATGTAGESLKYVFYVE